MIFKLKFSILCLFIIFIFIFFTSEFIIDFTKAWHKSVYQIKYKLLVKIEKNVKF